MAWAVPSASRRRHGYPYRLCCAAVNASCGALGYLVDRDRRQALLIHHRAGDFLTGIMAGPFAPETAADALTQCLAASGLEHLDPQWQKLRSRELPDGSGVLHLESWVAFVDLKQVPWADGVSFCPLDGGSLVPLDHLAEEDLDQVRHALPFVGPVASFCPRSMH